MDSIDFLNREIKAFSFLASLHQHVINIEANNFAKAYAQNEQDFVIETICQLSQDLAELGGVI